MSPRRPHKSPTMTRLQRPLHQQSADDDRDRPRARRSLRNSVEQVRQELFDAFGTRQVATIYAPSNDYEVILESLPEVQADPSALSRIFLKTGLSGAGSAAALAPGAGVTGSTAPTGPTVPLSAVTKIVPTVGPLQVNHQGQQPSVTISFNLSPGFSLGQAVDAIRQIERELNLPASVVTGFEGSAQVFQEFAARAGHPRAGRRFRGLCGARHSL